MQMIPDSLEKVSWQLESRNFTGVKVARDTPITALNIRLYKTFVTQLPFP